jgi:hypothetical protein
MTGLGKFIQPGDFIDQQLNFLRACAFLHLAYFELQVVKYSSVMKIKSL